MAHSNQLLGRLLGARDSWHQLGPVSEVGLAQLSGSLPRALVEAGCVYPEQRCSSSLEGRSVIQLSLSDLMGLGNDAFCDNQLPINCEYVLLHLSHLLNSDLRET